MGKGKVVQVIGTVVDVEFPPEQLPTLFNALVIDQSGEKLTLEVEQHVGNNWVRCLALGPTEGLSRGTEAVDTENPVMVPVGQETLGRLFNVMGEPLGQPGTHRVSRALAHPPTAPFLRGAGDYHRDS